MLSSKKMQLGCMSEASYDQVQSVQTHKWSVDDVLVSVRMRNTSAQVRSFRSAVVSASGFDFIIVVLPFIPSAATFIAYPITGLLPSAPGEDAFRKILEESHGMLNRHKLMQDASESNFVLKKTILPWEKLVLALVYFLAAILACCLFCSFGEMTSLFKHAHLLPCFIVVLWSCAAFAR